MAHRKETLGHVRAALTQNSACALERGADGRRCALRADQFDRAIARPSAHQGERHRCRLRRTRPRAELKGVGHPVLINGAERRAGRPPPVLGQHTDDVLGEIGLSSRETIGELQPGRVVG